MKSFNYLFICKPIYDIHLHQAKTILLKKVLFLMQSF